MRQSYRVTLTSLFLAATLLIGGAASASGAGPATRSAVLSVTASGNETTASWLAALWLVVRLQIPAAGGVEARGRSAPIVSGKHFAATTGLRPALRHGRFLAPQGGGINPNGGQLACLGGGDQGGGINPNGGH